jgi:hypothetical protein
MVEVVFSCIFVQFSGLVDFIAGGSRLGLLSADPVLNFLCWGLEHQQTLRARLRCLFIV